MYELIIRPILFALSQGDAERAHTLTLKSMHVLQKVPFVLRLLEWLYEAHLNPHPVDVCGITFPNRVGLPAGLDKHAEAVLFLQALGIGFLEVGTVLPHYQYGNDRPRLFRVRDYDAIINSMGFNSEGAGVVASRLGVMRPHIRIPIGISLGKMKGTPNEHASADYVQALRTLRCFADFLVINISSPNTPGLRELQGGKYLLKLVSDVVGAEKSEAAQRCGKTKPVFIKWSPDIEGDEIDEMYDACKEGGASGLIIGNTTLSRPRIGGPYPPGGWSGPNMRAHTCELIERVRRRDKNIPIIGVGGINSPYSAGEILRSGANLIQMYTGFVYQGPQLIKRSRAYINNNT